MSTAADWIVERRASNNRKKKKKTAQRSAATKLTGWMLPTAGEAACAWWLVCAKVNSTVSATTATTGPQATMSRAMIKKKTKNSWKQARVGFLLLLFLFLGQDEDKTDFV